MDQRSLLSRRDAVKLLGLSLATLPARKATGSGIVGEAALCRGDLAIDPTTALLISQETPLVPAAGLRDARAVWAGIPSRPDPSVLLFLHGFDHYVTVGLGGHSRVPDWAAGDPAARAGAAAKHAAPLVYGLDRLATRSRGFRPLLLVPEDGALATGGFWSRVPAGQYADPLRLGRLVTDCLAHLACLPRPDRRPYLSRQFTEAPLRRVSLCGHSGAGLVLQEAATSALTLPQTGVPTDLWLFDCTYWSQIAGFVEFCRQWHRAGRLAAGVREASRFVCVYRPGTQTEPVADVLRGEIARVLGIPAASLARDHTPTNLQTDILTALRTSAVLFLRTHVPHDDIPTLFIPILLQTAAS